MRKILLLIGLVVLLGSCATKEQVVYFRDVDSATLESLDSIYEAPTIQPNDILRIDLTALEPLTTLPYKFEKTEIPATSGNIRSDEKLLRGYLVSKEGVINYPGLGEVKMQGMSTAEAQRFLENKLSKYIKNPTVRVRLLNFKVTVLGQVHNPGTITSTEEALTIPQAIGMAGDLDIRGRRRNVLLIRQIDGQRFARRIDLTKSDWMSDPTYYLKQNDILYVEPNGPAVKSAGFISSIGNVLSTISILISIALLAFR